MNAADGKSWPKAVIFDLDGTLVDSAADIAAALNAAFVEAGMAPFTLNQVRGMVGGGVPILVERALNAASVQLDADAQQALTRRVKAIYQDCPVIDTVPYDGAVALLDELTAAGIKCGLCTNKPTEITEVVLRELALGAYFGSVVGGTSGFGVKPARAMLDAVCQQLGVAAGEAVLVGDSGADVGAARASGLKVVVVSYGYSRTPASDLRADLVIDHLSAVPAALSRLAAAAT